MSRSNKLAEEVEALKSIYEQDLKFNGEEIVITLFPLQEKEKKEIYAQLDLCVVCPESYPKKEPHLSLRNIKGLSYNHIETLYSKLKEMAQLLVGEVMIYNLAYFIQEFLSEHNQPGKKSCYEEMILRKEQQKKEEYQSEVHKKTKLLENIQERQREVLLSAEHNSSEDEEEKTDVAPQASDDPLVGSAQKKEMTCEHKNCKYIQFYNKVLRGCCIEHDSHSIIYCAIDCTTGDQLLLQEWSFKPKRNIHKLFQIFERQIDWKLAFLKNVCHENLISYIDFNTYFEKGGWTVQALQEYVAGFNLNALIDRSTDIDLNFIRHVTYGLLRAVDYLHTHGVVHGCLNGSSVYINKYGVIKVGNYRIKKMFDDLHEYCKCDRQVESIDLGKPTEKSDISEIGYLLLRLMKLSVIPNENILLPDFQPPELKDFIEKCLIENEDSRWSARKLLNHRFLKVKERKLTITRKILSGDDPETNPVETEKPYDGYFEGSENVNSRLAKEFKILQHLGSGSYGKVLKVKNKLDGSMYAIKAIRLNMKNKQLDKKIIREVKLLSKLNHENIVRYYTSWLETDSSSVDSSENEGLDVVDSQLSNKMSRSNVALESDDEEEEEEEEDEEDDEDEIDAKNHCQEKEKDQSSFIVFLRETSEENLGNGRMGTEKSQESAASFIEPNRTLYIQMEFCEKSTLRIAINDTSQIKLFEDEPRLWRLFREIVEGLAYVHGQGMIHRDLKPENIFLDSCDHVKIGDFGLATFSVVSKTFTASAGLSLGCGDNDASSQNIYDDYHTGKVGTSLYVAPELDKTYGKSYYNEKVDIYSLGIIFFEMCNGPFKTDMERIETLLSLRKLEIVLPSLWNEKFFKQRDLVKLLLNHDPKSRPSCQDILEGDYLPPAEFEHEQFQDILRQTLSNPKSKAYKYLISSCFDQEIRIEDDVTYQWENARSEKQHFILHLVKEHVENILKKHGAIHLSAPLLLPQNKKLQNIETRVQLMTHSGSIVNLPYDLRTSFARYVVCKGFTRMRRFVVGRVFREKKVHGLHPKEQYECAFDLVTPSPGIENAQAEVLQVVQEVVDCFKSLKNRNCVIRLNHSLLLRALLTHFNSQKWFRDILKILSEAKEDKYFKSKLEANLQRQGVQIRSAFINLLTKEDSFSNIKEELFPLLNKRWGALDMLNLAFNQLQALIEKVERLGVTLPIKISPGVVCNCGSGCTLMFDVVYRVKQKRKKEETVVLMSGCMYDELIYRFRRLLELTAANTGDDMPTAVGVSIYLDKIAAVLKEDSVLSEYVVICSFGNNALTRTKESIAKRLWESGIKCYVEQMMETVEELTEYCRENKIIHIINLKDEESGFAYVMTWDNDKNHYLEKKINVRDLTDHILKHSKGSEGGHSSPHFSRQSSEPQGRTGTGDALNGSQSLNIHIVSDEKLTATQRRRWENQLRTRVSSVAGFFSSRARLEVVGVFLDERKVRELTANFKAAESSENSFLDADPTWKPIKKYVGKICLKLRCLLSENSNAVIILYSLPQDKYQFIIDS